MRQLVLAFAMFSLPIFVVPLALRESPTDLWVRAGLPKIAVSTVLIPEGAPPVLYALAVNRGVYRSNDNGATWELANNGLPSATWGRIGVQALAVDVANSSVVYAGLAEIGQRSGALRTGLYVSDDYADGWVAVAGEMVGKEVQAIALTSAFPTLDRPSRDTSVRVSAVCVAAGAELYRSMDFGQSWSRLDWRGVETRIVSLAIRPGDADAIYVGTEGSGLYRTEDAGASWVASSQGLDNLDIKDIRISAQDTHLMYVATSSSAYRSTDAGASWTKLGGPTEGRRINAIALHPKDRDAVCAGLDYGAACCSSDRGTQWRCLKRGLGDLTVLSLEVDPRNPSILWAGTADGIWRYVFERWTLEGAPTRTASTNTVRPGSTSTPESRQSASATATATSSPSPTSTQTARPFSSATASSGATPTLQPTATASPTPTPTPTSTALPQSPALAPAAPTVGPTATERAITR